MNDRTKTIAVFIPALERGGVEKNVVVLSRGLLERGYLVHLLYCRAEEAFLDQMPEAVERFCLLRRPSSDRPGGILPGRVRQAVALLPALVRYMRRCRPDVVVSFQSSVSAVLARSLARSRARLIVRESNTASAALGADRHWFSRLVPRLKRCFYPRADAVVAVSQGVAADLIDRIGVDRKKVVVIYNPTFDDRLLERAAEPVDHPWLADDTVPVVLGLGRLTPQKDFATLLRAFAIVRRHKPCRLLVIGEGSQRQELARLADELGIDGDIQMPGFVVNPYPWLARCSVFALSSIYEGLPNALIEAVALKRPAVATDCPSGPREILLDGEAGVLVPMRDPDRLAAGIMQLLSNDSLRDRYVQRAFDGADRFRPARAVEKYVELIES